MSDHLLQLLHHSGHCTRLSGFIQFTLKFVGTYGFDCLDLDREYLGDHGGCPEDKQMLSCQVGLKMYSMKIELKLIFTVTRRLGGVVVSKVTSQQSYSETKSLKHKNYLSM